MDKMSIITLVLFAVVICMAGALVGYNIKGEAAVPAPVVAPDQIKAYGINDNGSTVIVTKNESLIILLEENPTTGYRWNATHTDGLTIVGDDYIPGNSSLIGSGGVRVWMIKATGLGDQSFSAVYSRPWENCTPCDGQFGMKIIVHDYNENGL